MSYTKEPWKVFTVYDHPEISDDNDEFIAALRSGDLPTAKRIVACINACAGIPTNRLESGAADILAYSMELHKQRDALLEAAETLLSRKRPGQTEEDPRLILEIDCQNLEDIVASVKGSAA